jgi:blocked-early-in-transport protein 1
MSESYDRERQNNSRLDELSAKVSALRGVTVDIYDNARAQDVIDNTVCLSTPKPLCPFLSPVSLFSRGLGVVMRDGETRELCWA